MKTYSPTAKLCVNGHDLSDPKIARIDSRGKRQCRPCDAARQLARNRLNKDICLPPDTPAKLVNYKEPLRPVVDGFGYLGTIAYDDSETFTQCHMCGFFYKHLHKHIGQSHDITSDEYKTKFGLEKRTSLLATNTRSIYLDHWEKLSPEEKAKRLQRLKEISVAGRRKQQDLGRDRYNSRSPKALEWYNKHGNCPDQIIDKILRLAEKLGRTPGTADFQKEYGVGYVKAAQHHFGSWAEAVKQVGLVPLRRHGQPWYSREFLLESLQNFARLHGREPYWSDTRTQLLPSATAYTRCFGGWTKAKEAAFNKDKPQEQ